MIDRTEICRQSDGMFLSVRYGHCFTRAELEQLRENINRALEGLGRMRDSYQPECDYQEPREEITQAPEAPPEKKAGFFHSGTVDKPL